MKISVATWNGWKYKQIISQLPAFVTPEQVDLDLPEIQTNLLSVISRDKCIQAYKKLLSPVLVDDTGMYFDVYNEFPGALTKFIHDGIGLSWVERLFSGVENKWSYMQTVLSYMDDQLEEPIQFIGELHGVVNFDRYRQQEENPKLPFEMIFIPEGMDKPAAFDQESRLKVGHHRIKASKLFSDRLAQNRQNI